MKRLLRVEEAAQLALAIFAISLQPVSIAWWLWPFVFLSPDLGMIGYLHSPKAGAWTYNLLHHKGVAGIAILAGYILHMPWLFFVGLVLFAHSAFDRMSFPKIAIQFNPSNQKNGRGKNCNRKGADN